VAGAWHCRLTQIARAMKLRPAQIAAGLRDATAAGSVVGDTATGGDIDLAAGVDRFGGASRCVGEAEAEGSALGAAVDACACSGSAATAGGTGAA